MKTGKNMIRKKTIPDIIGMPKVMYLIPRVNKRLYGEIKYEVQNKKLSKFKS